MQLQTKDVLDKVDLAFLLDCMGFDEVDSSKESYQGLCRFHDDNKTKSFSADLLRGLWHCFGCGRGGNSIGLYALWKNITYQQALEELAENPTIRDLRRTSLKKSEIGVVKRLELYKYFVDLLDRYNSHAEYLRSRCITKYAIDELGVRFIPKDLDSLQRKLLAYESIDLWKAIGIFDKDDSRFVFWNHPIIFPFYIDKLKTKPIFFQARCVGKKSDIRYLTPSSAIPGFINHRAIYGSDRLYICEGPTDALSLIEIGIKDVVAIPGARSLQLNWLEDFSGTEIVLCFDNDKAGDEAYNKYSQLLGEALKVDILRFCVRQKDINAMLCENRSII